MDNIALPRLYERDIDVVLQEELLFSDTVRDLVSRALGLVSPMHVDQCHLSVVDETGETDVLATFVSGNRRGVLLVENKIDAMFQPRQPARYRERADSFGAREGVEFAFCILVAPKDYVRAGTDGLALFDVIITYEELAEAIARDGSGRSAYRASLLTHALEHARSAYIMMPSEAVGELWRRIYGIAKVEFPELKMPVPSEKGGQSRWVIFKANLPAKITIDWKIPKAMVDLSFWKGARPRPKSDVNLLKLRPGATREMLGGTTVIRIPLTSACAEWITVSDDTIRDALSAAKELLDFFHCNPESFS